MITKHTIKAWHIYPTTAKIEDLNDPDRLAFSNMDMKSHGWLLVGEADITLRIQITPESMAISMCETLRQQIKDIQSKSQLEINKLEDQIKQLQSLTYQS